MRKIQKIICNIVGIFCIVSGLLLLAFAIEKISIAIRSKQEIQNIILIIFNLLVTPIPVFIGIGIIRCAQDKEDTNNDS
jgi:hypothetical protein